MKALIFGGGKIARGFIGHLLHLSGATIVFVDVNAALIEAMRRRGKYRVHIMGAAHKSIDISGFRGYELSDVQAIAGEWAEADMAFTAVGGKNLSALGQVLAAAFCKRCDLAPWVRPFNIVTCENWKEPACLLAEAIRSRLPSEYEGLFDRWVGVTEAVVMRSAVEPTEDMLADDPLCVNVQDFWDLPVDRDRWKGGLPAIEGVRFIEQFAGFLERKFYTYNAANGTVSYLGYLRKHRYICEAASDPEIMEVLDCVYEETSRALALKHNVQLQEQLRFADSSKKKLQDSNIIDYVERNARDPIRKLGPHDRLVGSARLVQASGAAPEGLAVAIAAALFYDEPTDSGAIELKALRESAGIDAILRDVCSIAEDDPLALLIKNKVEWLRTKRWIQ
ncbi:mannitol-1-phosphate 5-dehydrogenase [Paenibacillus montanisoli]|uniref:Mannitol-1-phosphate 5-dehydrogenase n=1 Tax=Paenibacillus montanisoli TaxID=2081970 RepID=A0A328U6K7_9BACL|nr:mannitol-1-phosphate 5-dehydrogenase [Paenibacillus montanisoli]RAP76585.1 mannitol-1-phosphate 5-dehydrogenase [Paenibacillus montanisoli]